MSAYYKPGNIRRIYVKDFLTYEEIEVIPTPHLNVVIGPNTTGKSSILCAICIGLGGKPEITGRGKSISEYIKHGKDSAIIEIELHNPKGKHSVIRRHFNLAGKSNWTFNGKNVTQKIIEEGVKLLGIRVDNLCQFLPQDRVSEFAKLNKIDLLLSTEKAIGEVKLAEEHALLCSNAQQTIAIKQSLENLRKQLEAEIKKNEQIESQVRNVYEKMNLEKTIKTLKLCKCILQIEELKAQGKDLKSSQIKLSKELNILEERLVPRNREISAIDNELKNIAKEVSQRLEHSKKLEKDSSHVEQRFADGNEAIENAIQNFARTQSDHARNLENIADLKRQLSVMQQQLNESKEVDETKLASEIQSTTSGIQKTSRNLNTLTNQIEQNLIDKRKVELTIAQKEKELKEMENIRRRRLKLLLDNSGRNRKLNKNTYDATEWLQTNRHVFQSNIYDPMFCELDVQGDYAKYVESSIPQRDILAFVCESKDDVNTFKQTADRYHWTINIIHSTAQNPNGFQPSCPIQQLQRLGFDGYLSDVIKAPMAILSYLCKSFRLHNVPVALKEASVDRVPHNIPVYYSGHQRYTKSKSRYDGQVSTTVDRIRNASFLGISSSSKDFETLKWEKTQLERRFQSFIETGNTLSEERVTIENQLEELRVQKRALTDQRDERKRLEARMQQKQSEVERRQRNLQDIDAAEAKMHEDIKNSHNGMSELLNRQCDVQKELSALAIQDHRAILKNFQSNQKRDRLVKESEEEREAIANKKVEISQVEQDMQEVKTKALVLKNELKSYRISESQYEEILRKGKKSKLDDVEKDLAEAEARKECLYMSIDETVISEFERRKKDIKILQQKVAEKEDLIQNRDKNIEETKRSWIPKITELTERINDHFSSYMDQLDCAGQVILEKGADENDFSKYGLGIKVKFRDSEKLSDLTVHQQSGGERSVSTALYLLALQTLTAVPFRCVDEINQGMDATNERKMFSMLVESTSKDQASQYFLVTPKLLPNLPYNKRVNFKIVYNGQRMAKHNYCKTKQILEMYKSP